MATAPEPSPATGTGRPDWLGPDLAGLVAALNVPVTGIVTLTRLRAPGVSHASFRLELADGRVLKGRRLASADQVALVTALVSVVDPAHFPRVIAHAGAALLEEWRSGEPLSSSDLDPSLARRCGGILGALHRAPPPAVAAAERARPEARLKAIVWQSRRLERAGGLTGEARSLLLRLAEAHLPADPAIGVIHRDFCAENLVRDAAGQLHVVDNETMQIGALDFDLARTWYRWPMTDREAAAFREGYAEHRDPASFLKNFLFWTLAVLVDASFFHLRVGTDRAPGALALLQTVLGGATPVGRWLPPR